MRRAPAIVIITALCVAHPSSAKEFSASSNAEFAAAAKQAGPGDTIVLSGGPFSGVHVSGLRGEKGKQLIVRGRSADEPARFRGGNGGLHLVRPEWVTLRFLDVAGAKINGINIDDGGDKANPARGIVVEDCTISDIGPRGNFDGLKMSGVDMFLVRRCTFTGWGGSAIDMVGCHDGKVENCEFFGKDGFSQSNAVQMKGGTARIGIFGNFFKGAGQRALNIGGSTGLQYFRPKVGEHEAEEIEVAGNRFVGGMAPIAWVTCKGGHVHRNTIYKPDKWIARILQENADKGFKPANGGVFENNLIVFDGRVRTFVNVGGGTAPDTFTFRDNAWFEDGGGRRPTLPTRETGGVYGVDPELSDPGGKAMAITSRDPKLAGKGADAYR